MASFKAKMIRTLTTRTMKVLLFASGLFNIILLLRLLLSSCTVSSPSQSTPKLPLLAKTAEDPLENVIFVGGVPRSGTTLARVMLDAHPDIRCGEESRVLPRVVGMRSKWAKSDKEHQRLLEAGLSDSTLDKATKAFVSYIILNHGEDAKHLCNKDPLLLNYMIDLKRMYPRAKFILMIRDGRAVAHSIKSRNVTISGVNNQDVMSAALFWNRSIQRMYSDCNHLGNKNCMMVYYEKLVNDPRLWMERVLEFLGVAWHDNVIHHHELVNKEIHLSRLEPSSNQVKEPVNTAATDKWREALPLSLQRRIYSDCKMLKELGYPP